MTDTNPDSPDSSASSFKDPALLQASGGSASAGIPVSDKELFALLVEGTADYALVLIDVEGRIASWNMGAQRINGYEEAEIVGQSFSRFFTPEDVAQGVPEQLLQQAREQGRADNERWQIRKDGSRFWASGVDQALRDDAGHLRGYSIVFRDLTQQRNAEETLRRSEERLRRMMESAVEFAIFTLDEHNRVMDWNVGAERVLGYTALEVIGQPGSLFFTPEDIAAGEVEKEFLTAKWKGRAEDERWHVRKDGSRFWASGILTLMAGVSPPAMIKVMRDFTANKQIEEQRAAYQAHIAVLGERNRLAQEIHDTLAQSLTAIALQLASAKAEIRAAPEAAEARMERIITLARQSLVEARRSVQALRPLLLESSDLPNALAELVKQMSVETTAHVQFTWEGTPWTLTLQQEDDLLRICQEALANALRHADASEIEVTLTYTVADARLRVQDNGRGFAPEAAVPPGHFGLIGMRERARRSGAQLTLHSGPERGTEVILRVPHRADTE